MDSQNYTVIFPDSPQVSHIIRKGRGKLAIFLFLLFAFATLSTFFFSDLEQRRGLLALAKKNINASSANSSVVPTQAPKYWKNYLKEDWAISFNYPGFMFPKIVDSNISFVERSEIHKIIFDISLLPQDASSIPENISTIKTIDAQLGLYGPIKLSINKVPDDDFEIVGYFGYFDDVLKFRYSTKEESIDKDLLIMETILSTFKFQEKPLSDENIPQSYPTIALPTLTPTPNP